MVKNRYTFLVSSAEIPEFLDKAREALKISIREQLLLQLGKVAERLYDMKFIEQRKYDSSISIARVVLYDKHRPLPILYGSRSRRQIGKINLVSPRPDTLAFQIGISPFRLSFRKSGTPNPICQENKKSSETLLTKARFWCIILAYS